jgi:hypothetical protein
MTTTQAQDLLDRNAETIRDILKLQEEVKRSGPTNAAATERKERLMSRLHRRLLKLARWSDAPLPERQKSDVEFDYKEAIVSFVGFF